MLLSSCIHFCMVSLFKALGRLLKALEALFRDGLHSREHLLVGGDRSAEEAQVGLGDLGISLLFPLLKQGTCILHVALEQRDRTLKDTLGVLQVTCLSCNETLCQYLAIAGILFLRIKYGFCDGLFFGCHRVIILCVW